ncbi:uncharacterized protein BDR25DRAFT_345271 [Lindgomyces ingoldianus]|uniref:Uncharacterized protein n=1 Tax=Lindgomyces ingoldianus TaxID=673940 RepID=A0ACB6QJR3_9PLEO|nr:uncharacterized protein BDR25DRAFT_345271 [Lindgomyces ingoldianus]KAF2467126.1 hypothetical protein BDR25DRAFT_345271 [Lindgomyces ingoldianus]
MATQSGASNQPGKSQLPNPYAAVATLPNPYAHLLPTPPGAEGAAQGWVQDKQEEEQKQKKNGSRLLIPPCSALFFTPSHLTGHRARSSNQPQNKKPKFHGPAPKQSSTDDAASAASRAAAASRKDFLRTTEEDLVAADIYAAKHQAQRGGKRGKKKREMMLQQQKQQMKSQWNRPYDLHYPTDIDAFAASSESNSMFIKFLQKIGVENSSDESNPESPTSSYSRMSSAEPMETSPPPEAPDDENDAYRPHMSFAPPLGTKSSTQLLTTSPTVISEASTGEEAYMIRMRLSQQPNVIPIPPPPPPPEDNLIPSLPPGPSYEPVPIPSPPPPPPESLKPIYSSVIEGAPVRYERPSPPNQPYSAVISGAPVHYKQPDQSDLEMEDARPELTPKKKEKKEKTKPMSIGERMMAKMGYKKGEGLGKDNDGILEPLSLKIANRKTVVDSGPTVHVFTGGKRKREDEDGEFGKPSSVIVTWGCVDGVNFAEDADRSDGGIRQEMGDFGTIERIHVHLGSEASSKTVYIKFNSPLGALNAVNRFKEGFEFQGRTIRALYYDEDKFRRGNFDE